MRHHENSPTVRRRLMAERGVGAGTIAAFNESTRWVSPEAIRARLLSCGYRPKPGALSRTRLGHGSRSGTIVWVWRKGFEHESPIPKLVCINLTTKEISVGDPPPELAKKIRLLRIASKIERAKEKAAKIARWRRQMEDVR